MNIAGRGKWWLIGSIPIVALLAGAGVRVRHSAGAVPTRHVVEISGMEFHPAVLQLARGDTVVWINRDIVPHTATAATKPAWDTGTLPSGQDGRYVPSQEGEARYICTLHPTMQGRLIVW